jgi:hypothetical protein
MAEIKIWQDIPPGKTKIGSIIFDEHPTSLFAERTATGFNLRIPAQIGLKSASENKPRLTLNNLSLIFSVNSPAHPTFEVGRLHHDKSYSAFVDHRREEPSESLRDMDLTWVATFPSLIAIEKSREGNQPRLHVELHADLCYIVYCQHIREASNGYPVFTVPRRIVESAELTYPVEVWEAMVRKLLAESQDDAYLMLLPFSSFLVGRKP